MNLAVLSAWQANPFSLSYKPTILIVLPTICVYVLKYVTAVWLPITSDVTKFSLPYKYNSALQDWARQEGLNVETAYNNYGVKHIRITL